MQRKKLCGRCTHSYRRKTNISSTMGGVQFFLYHGSVYDEIPPLFRVVSNTPVPLFLYRHSVFLERWFSLVTFPFAQALPCGNVHWDRLLVSFLLCSAFSSTHPDSICVEVTMHICCMAQAVASKSFGSVDLPALPSHAYLIRAWTPRYARSQLRSRTIARTQRVTNTLSGSGASCLCIVIATAE